MTDKQFDACPFCGHPNIILECKPTRKDPNLSVRFARCETCGITTRPLVDYVDGTPEQIIAKIYKTWNERPRAAVNEELRTLIREVETLVQAIVEAKNKKTLTATQRDAMEMIQGKLDAIMPAARRANRFVPLPVIRVS